ncbi:MAG: mRNA-decapping enzyme 1B [Icmadophila ericetorum]|nr:mRNA-decapping enzyme 1B [Icmadophila ericetorum]
MTPRKPKYQQLQQQATLQPSDNESDLNYTSDAIPPPPSRTDHELNLSVLKRHNKSIISLEYVTPYVVVYAFSPTTQQWEKSGIEGTAFVCGLAPSDESVYRYAVMVLNRRGLENFSIELQSTSNVEVMEEYIILQSENNGVPQVHGIWVFCEPPPSSTSQQREATALKIQGCAAKGELGRKLVEEQQASIQAQESGNAMSRTLSLREHFGQQRSQDENWAVAEQNHQAYYQSVSNSSADFHHNSAMRNQTPSPAVSAQSVQPQQIDLLNLFRSTGGGV